MGFRLIQGDCLEKMRDLPSESINAVITDPPYGLEFMGKEWDKFDKSPKKLWGFKKEGDLQNHPLHNRPSMERGMPIYIAGSSFQSWVESWGRECLRVLKPGGFLMAFGGTRTHHRLTCGLEDAGFLIRDELCWVYATGFPKAQDLSYLIDEKEFEETARNFLPAFRQIPVSEKAKEYSGFKTPALKPAFEPIVLCQKPCEGSITENVLKHGVGGFNIDACRISFENEEDLNEVRKQDLSFLRSKTPMGNGITLNPFRFRLPSTSEKGRYPSNVILTEPVFDDDVEGVIKEKEKPEVGHNPRRTTDLKDYVYAGGWRGKEQEEAFFKEGGSYSKFFLIPKAGNEKNEDLSGTEFSGDEKPAQCLKFNENSEFEGRRSNNVTHKNIHPTVKPLALMEHLVKLVARKGDSSFTVLDPFLGSGTTLLACRRLGVSCIGIEKSGEYCEIVKKRWGSTLGEELEEGLKCSCQKWF